MKDFPHHYLVTASAEFEGNVALKSDDVPELATALPEEFSGPGNQWSPETLLTGAVLTGFIFTFRTISHSTGLEWSSLKCSAEGVLERVERVNRFTSFTIRATLTAPADADIPRLENMLEKAQAACLVAQSLLAVTHLETDIVTDN
jgi:organic hydroperoxide reductase OsmC/OhrA